MLDMGTGSGVNGIVAASRSRAVLAVDVNPSAVACARDNAERNGVADRVTVRKSDLFQNASGRFDLIIFDPPFRWFPPRDMFERGTADENYRSLTTFFDQASDHLEPGGRILLSFGTTGDIDYLHHLITTRGFAASELRKFEGEKGGFAVTYFNYRLIIPPVPNAAQPTKNSSAVIVRTMSGTAPTPPSASRGTNEATPARHSPPAPTTGRSQPPDSTPRHRQTNRQRHSSSSAHAQRSRRVD